MNTANVKTIKPAMCLRCGEWFSTALLANEHWIEVHKADHEEYLKRRLEKFGR